jgi:hypothetical protein
MCQHQYWREKRWVLYYSREEAKKQDFFINVATSLLDGKVHGYSPVPEQRPENSARNEVAPLLGGKSIGYCTAAEQRPENRIS